MKPAPRWLLATLVLAAIALLAAGGLTTQIRHGGTLPTSCSGSDLFMKTGASAGLYSNTASPTCSWTGPLGAGGAGGPSSNAAYLSEEFLGGTATSGHIGQYGWVTNGGGGGLTLVANAVANHPGIVDLQGGASNDQWEFLCLFQGASALNCTSPQIDRMDNKPFDIVFDVEPKRSTQVIYRMGFFNDGGSQNPSDGIYWEYSAAGSSGNWSCVTMAGTSPTSNDSGQAVDTANFHQFEIAGAGSGTMRFLYDGTQVCSQATHVPTAAVLLALEDSCSAACAAQPDLWIDFVSMPTFTVSR